jgi:CXXX repeat modification system protein
MTVKIQESEKNAIQQIFIKKQSLMELISACREDNDFSIGLKNEYMGISKNFNEWFTWFENKYQVTGEPNAFWNVNFNTNEVVLTKMPQGGSI